MRNSKKLEGFTLIEILVVVALIAILAAITYIAINPAKNFADARNTQRQSDVREILSAITQFQGQGNTVSSLGSVPTCPAVANIGTDNVNLATNLVPEYIVAIPKDPLVGTDANTGYTICQETGGRVTVNAPSAENSKTIQVKR